MVGTLHLFIGMYTWRYNWDRYITSKNSVLYGGFLLCAGHFTLAFQNELFFFTGLILIILGVGLLKPNISTLVGHLYKINDLRRDQGFTIFYIGINVGAFLASILVGYVGEVFGWHYGFLWLALVCFWTNFFYNW